MGLCRACLDQLLIVAYSLQSGAIKRPIAKLGIIYTTWRHNGVLSIKIN